MNFCVLRCETVNQKALICLYQKCCTIRGIQCDVHYRCCGKNSASEDALMLSYFSSLHYCNLYYLYMYQQKPTMVQDVINSCKELKYVRYHAYHTRGMSLNLVHNHNLQQLYIEEVYTDVPDEFMTSVSEHGGLVHIVMIVQSSTAEGITSLVRNSPKLLTLYFTAETIHRLSVEKFDARLRKMFCKRKLFTAGHYILCGPNQFSRDLLDIRLWEQGTDILPLW